MVLTDFSTREASVVLSSVSTAVARTVEVEPTLRREVKVGVGLHDDEGMEECDLRPEKEGRESETRSEEGLEPCR